MKPLLDTWDPGMQEGDDPKWPLKIHATLKHYTAYSIETN